MQKIPVAYADQSSLLSSGLYRRHRNLTGSAIARGLIDCCRFTAGGESRPAPKLCLHYRFGIFLCQDRNRKTVVLYCHYCNSSGDA